MTCHLLINLHNDWHHRRNEASTTAWLTAATRTQPPLSRFTDLVALESFVHDRTAPREDVDHVLVALLTLHQRGDAIAASVLLGVLLPAIGRRVAHSCGRDEYLAQLVAELCHVFAHYPVATPPPAVALDLIRRARKRTCRALTPAGGEPTDTAELPDQLPAAVAVCPYTQAEHRADLRSLLRNAIPDSGISNADLAIIAITRVRGMRIADLATGRAADRLRQRRHRAERRLGASVAA